MNDMLINQVVVPVIVAVIGSIMELFRRQVGKYLDSKQELIEKQKQAIEQSVGIEQYNKDKAVVQDAVKAAEQIGKEFDWEGTLKHSKVLELVEGKTGLTDEQIFYIIKATVGELNSNLVTNN